MSATLAVALVFAQGVSPAITVEAGRDRLDVGYSELKAQRPAEAIERIEANRRLEPTEPVAEINLGTAKARLGDRAAARGHFRTALASRERYDLELADGTWLDSRAAARLALKLLETNRTLALK